MIKKIKELFLIISALITLGIAVLMLLVPQLISWPLVFAWLPFAFYFAVHLPNEDANELESNS